MDPRSPSGPEAAGDPPPQEPVNLRRHLFFGLALLLAFGSMYVGLLAGLKPLQYALAIGALIAVALAFTSRAPRA